MRLTTPTTAGSRDQHAGSVPVAVARGLAALAGVLAAAVTLGVAHLVAALVAPEGTPLIAVGEAFIDLTPAWLKDAAIAVFGTADKVALLVGMALVVAALAALAGVLARRRWGLGATLVMALAAVGGLAAMSRGDAGALAPVPSIVGGAAGLVALRSLLRRIPDPPAAPVPAETAAVDLRPLPPPGALARRSFLTAALVAAGMAAVSTAGGRLLGQVVRTADAARAALRLPRPARAAPPLPAGVEAGAPGVVPFVTPSSDFYRIDTALLVPQVDPGTWELRVHGLVEQDVTLTFAELMGSDLVEAWVTLACVSNPVGGDLVGNAKWLGYPTRELLARARPRPEADMVLSTSADGFTASTPLAVLTDSRDALLAVGMNDEPLPLAHGFPVRMVVPGLYGYVSATKWVVDLEVTRFADRRAYWTDRGWSAEGPIKTASRIEVPRPGTPLRAGPVVVAGTAWAQHRGITGVEVRVDDGAWEPAALAAEASVDTWRQWSYRWDASSGDHRLTVRATDGTDRVQTAERASPAPDGASGWHAVDVTVE
ncbi:molybdopterin-dependent oxidoreductase [Cellulomonas fimi]|uniref:Molybdopterin-dependent oxidoreductase n=1 Tax=Cellulomonas fimi TaxID=1708 RepID=A0A7Y0QGI4_CELFI|nr:molybdopterin-dependent oxidoreductase [Cellulomonas fimi]NMR19128.1 molybdopterin-dependent oxidoreductase [Cellulomonas fimi]